MNKKKSETLPLIILFGLTIITRKKKMDYWFRHPVSTLTRLMCTTKLENKFLKMPWMVITVVFSLMDKQVLEKAIP